MAEKRKALFFDIDGTILSEKVRGYIPESAVKAIREARENGHLTFINTGRTRACVPMEIQNLGFDGVLCGCGTEIIYHGESRSHKRLSKEFCLGLAEAILKADVGAILEGEEFWFVQPKRPVFDFLNEGGGLDSKNMKIHYDWKVEDVIYDKLVFWEDEESCSQIIFDYVKGELDVIVRGNGFYELVPCGYDKAKAIQIIQEMFDIALEDTYVFGDSSNDLAMFQYSPNAIAMKEHDPVLDPYTSYVTDSVEEDGIEKALKALKLI